MRRVKRSTAAVLCLFLSLGGPAAEAGGIGRAPVVELSAPVLLAFSPSAPTVAPLSVLPLALSPGPVLLSPSSPSLIPAPIALLVVPAKNLPVIVPSVQPVASALRVIAAPENALGAGRLFDGGGALAAAKDDGPVVGGTSGASSPRLDPPAKAKRPGSTAGRFLRAAAVGVGASALAPLLWAAIPSVSALLLFSIAILPVAVAATALLAARAVRAVYRFVVRPAPVPAKTPPSRRFRNWTRAIGVAFGIGLSAATFTYQVPLIERGYTYLDSRLPAGEGETTTVIPGKSFADETVRVLSQTEEGRAALDRVRGSDGVPRMPEFSVKESRQKPVALQGTFFADSAEALLSRSAIGREVLDGLRDRGGVVRMPMFFVSYQKGSAAQYTPPDVVFLSVSTIEDSGITVEQFLRDPQAQLDYLEREQAVIVHELKHADQARRFPFNSGTWRFLRVNGARLDSAAKTYFFGSKGALVSTITGAGKTPAHDFVPAVTDAEVKAVPIVLDAAEIRKTGMTVERFLADHKAQRDYIVRHQAELALALKAVPRQAKTSAPTGTAVLAPSVTSVTPAAPAAGFHPNFGMLQEWEYEAYITEHFYTHERLKADPATEITGGELYGYARGLVDFDAYLRSIDGSEIYAANFLGHAPYYEKYLAGMRAGWDAHRVEAYVLLARRELAKGDLYSAKARLAEARAIAAEKGLPAPDLVIPDR